jgi:hypothetical protein
MKTFTSTNIFPFEDYSTQLIYNTDKKYYKYLNCSNQSIISEGSFNRLLDRMKNNDFAIITAYRSTFTKEENIMRNRKLRGILDKNRMGVHQLVGHWQEAPSGVDYKDAKKSELTDSVERSYMVAKPEKMSDEEFKKIIIDCMTIDNETQDAVVYKHNSTYYIIYNNGEEEKIGDKMTLNKISQAYSQYVKQLDVPFVFEGYEEPVTNLGKQIFRKHNILY